MRITAAGTTTLSFVPTDSVGKNGVLGSIVLKLDPTAPPCRARAPPGWSGTDVSILCTGADPASGLADPADASFSLTTAVAAGTETANATTGSRSVCDKVGQCATAGPVGGIKVDKKGPAVAISSPASGAQLAQNSAARRRSRAPTRAPG